MCGINGIFTYGGAARGVDRGELLRTRDSMAPRGPDGEGEWISDDGRVGFGHRRLAIIDLSDGGRQPMSSGDGNLVIVFNGEIYNHRELRTSLEERGRVFRTQSDTEVLLQLYAEYGAGMLQQLRGMYAFAIFDKARKGLFMARDPFGIKPLYIADDGQTLRFASQVKALIAGGAVSREVSPQGEAGYWIWGHVPEPLTIYKDIRALEPGTWRMLGAGGCEKSGAFDSVAGFLGLTAGDACETKPQPQASLREVLLDSVRHHLISDVPVGLFLSSGIDSATLLALAAECGARLNTITLGFSEFRGTADDETPLAEELARTYGAQHETVWVGRADFETALEEFLDDMDQPSIDGLNTWLVCHAAARLGYKVALSGLGGDEFFGGYPSFTQLPRMRMIARPFGRIPGLAKMLRKVSAPLFAKVTSQKFAGVLEYGGSWEGAYMLRRALRMPWELETGRPDTSFSGEEPAGAEDYLMVSHLEATRYMRNQLLRDSDWASMAHSIELRVPLVDKEVARCVGRQAQRGKPFIKRDLASSARPALPPNVVDRPKTGFSVPIRSWMLGDFTSTSERGLRPWQSLILARAGLAA